MTHLQYNTNIHHSIEQIEIFLTNLKNFYEDKIKSIDKDSSSQESRVSWSLVIRIKERVEESVKELESLANELRAGSLNIPFDIALRGSVYFDNVVL